MDNKEKFKQAISCLIDRDDNAAKKIIKEAIQQDYRYISYKEQLRKFGLDLKSVEVPEKVYEKIKKAISRYDRMAQLAILDRTFIDISKNNL